jgi:hypothetical protein
VLATIWQATKALLEVAGSVEGLIVALPAEQGFGQDARRGAQQGVFVRHERPANRCLRR